MAGFRQCLKKGYDKIPDWLWPHLTGEPVPAPDEQLLPDLLDAKLLESMEHSIEGRLNQVNDRLRNVEAKLVALLTLTSVLSVAVTAVFAVALAVTPYENLPSAPVWISLALVSYLAVNLLRSLWATVGGLMRRGFREVPYSDLVPRGREDQLAYRSRILAQHLNHAQWNDWVLDQKVSELAVAHVAFRNALSATGGMILLAAFVGLSQRESCHLTF